MLGSALSAASRHAIFLSLVLIPSLTDAQPITFDWSRRFGGTLDDAPHEVVIDGQGNVLATGTFRGTVDFGGGPLVSAGGTDVFLLKLDADGAFVHAARFGSTGDDVGTSVAADESGNRYLYGTFSGTIDFGGGPLLCVGAADIFLASFDSDGNHRWSKRFRDTQPERIGGLAVDTNGSTTISGSFLGTIDFGGGPFRAPSCYSAFVVRFNEDGTHVWSIEREGACDGPYVDYGAGPVALGPSGNSCVLMSPYVCDDFGCQEAPSVEEFGPSGTPLSEFALGELCSDIAIDASGHIYIIGRYPVDDFDGQFVAKHSAAHDQLWGQDYSPYEYGFFHFKSISTNVDGSILVVGVFDQTLDLGDGLMTSAGDYDIFALRLSPSGDLPRTQRIGGTARDWAGSGAGAEAGVFVIAGEFAGTTDVGGQSLTSAGGNDVLVTKIRFPTEVAVAISEFRATSAEGIVTLDSRFRSDLGVVAVNVYRRLESDHSFSRIARVAGDGGDRYQFVDRDVEPGGSYRYQIGVVDADGEFLSPAVMVSVEAMNAELGQNRPNPFNPTTTIRFVLPSREHVVVSVFDGNGRHVRSLLDGVRSHGPHEITWDGRDDSGAPVSSGVYFYRLAAGAFQESKKMVLLK